MLKRKRGYNLPPINPPQNPRLTPHPSSRIVFAKGLYCSECGRKLGNKTPKPIANVTYICDQCFNLNRQMPIETAVYRDIHGR